MSGFIRCGLDAVKTADWALGCHAVGFGTPCWRGHLLTDDLQDGFVLQGGRFVKPFKRANVRLSSSITKVRGFA
jgi:hypothetical protein